MPLKKFKKINSVIKDNDVIEIYPDDDEITLTFDPILGLHEKILSSFSGLNNKNRILLVTLIEAFVKVHDDKKRAIVLAVEKMAEL